MVSSWLLNSRETHLLAAMILSLRKPSKAGRRVDTFLDYWLKIAASCVSRYIIR